MPAVTVRIPRRGPTSSNAPWKPASSQIRAHVESQATRRALTTCGRGDATWSTIAARFSVSPRRRPPAVATLGAVRETARRERYTPCRYIESIQPGTNPGRATASGVGWRRTPGQERLNSPRRAAIDRGSTVRTSKLREQPRNQPVARATPGPCASSRRSRRGSRPCPDPEGRRGR